MVDSYPQYNSDQNGFFVQKKCLCCIFVGLKGFILKDEKASWAIVKAHSNQKCIHCLITLYLNLNPTISPECLLMDREKQRKEERRGDEGEIEERGE